MMVDTAAAHQKRRRATISPARSRRPAIVCGVDQSHASREALHVADRLGQRLQLRLVVAHVLPFPLILFYPEIAHAAAAPYDVEADCRAGHELLETEAKGVPLETNAAHKIAFGEPTAALIAIAEEEDAVVIVVGSRRRSIWDAAVHGSITAGLALHATRPVLIVPIGAARTRG
jgi:nucleotide-binding universal stress UspA family protein